MALEFPSLPGQLFALLLLAALFIPVERLFPLHRGQKVFRRQWGNDLVHFFVNGYAVQVGLIAGIVALAVLARVAVPQGWRDVVGGQPAWAQILEGFVILELVQYGTHRAFHTVGWMWRFHQVHHTIKELDWLAAARLHPVDQALSKTIGVAPLILLGFSLPELTFVTVLFTLWAIFLHSNTRFRFGPLRYLIATPEFHHWHHSNEPQAYTKNLAGLFPWVDMLFGTFYLPDRWPAVYGVGDPVPETYLGQMAYPFRRPPRP